MSVRQNSISARKAKLRLDDSDSDDDQSTRQKHLAAIERRKVAAPENRAIASQKPPASAKSVPQLALSAIPTNGHNIDFSARLASAPRGSQSARAGPVNGRPGSAYSTPRLTPRLDASALDMRRAMMFNDSDDEDDKTDRTLRAASQRLQLGYSSAVKRTPRGPPRNTPNCSVMTTNPALVTPSQNADVADFPENAREASENQAGLVDRHDESSVALEADAGLKGMGARLEEVDAGLKEKGGVVAYTTPSLQEFHSVGNNYTKAGLPSHNVTRAQQSRLEQVIGYVSEDEDSPTKHDIFKKKEMPPQNKPEPTVLVKDYEEDRLEVDSKFKTQNALIDTLHNEFIVLQREMQELKLNHRHVVKAFEESKRSMGGEIQALKSEIRGLRAKLADDENSIHARIKQAERAAAPWERYKNTRAINAI